MKRHHIITILIILVSAFLLSACGASETEPVVATEIPPTAEIVISSSTDTPVPEPTVAIKSFLPELRSPINNDNVSALRLFGELPGTAGSHVAISPDNHWLATAQTLDGGRITIWNLLTGEQEKVLDGAWTLPIRLDTLFFLPDGVLVSHLIPIGRNVWKDSRAQYWDVNSGEIMKEFYCWYIKYSQDGTIYAYMPEFDEDSMIVYVADAGTDNILQVFQPGYRVHSLQFSGDNSTLVGSTGNGWQSMYIFWDLEKGIKSSVLYDATCLSYSEMPVFAAILENQSSNDVGELATLYQADFEKDTITYDADIGWGCPPVFTRSTDLLVANSNNYVRFYNALNGKELNAIHVFAQAKIIFSPDKTFLVLNEYENNVKLYAVFNE